MRSGEKQQVVKPMLSVVRVHQSMGMYERQMDKNKPELQNNST